MFRKWINPSEPLSIFLIGGVGTWKTYTLMVIIESFLHFYLKENKDLDPSKQTILKMAYTGKTTYNIGGSTIHSTYPFHWTSQSMIPNLVRIDEILW